MFKNMKYDIVLVLILNYLNYYSILTNYKILKLFYLLF